MVGVWGVADPDKYKKRWPFTLGSVYVLTGPVVHLTKDHPDRAWKSLGLRVAMPLVAGGLGALGGERSAFGGVALGMAAAVILDAAILGSSEGTQVPDSDDGWIRGAGPWVDLEGRAFGASVACAL